MNQDFPDYFPRAAAEALLVLGALAILGLDISIFRRRAAGDRLRFALGVGIVAVLAAAVFAAGGAARPGFGGVLIFDPLAVATRIGILVPALLTLPA